jgi:GAF domain-containing protein
MLPFTQLRQEFEAAVLPADESAADRLCTACVDLLQVDGASISLLHDREAWGTFGASGEVSRRLDEFQFTFGEGPCLDAVAQSKPVMVPDLAHPADSRWPAFMSAVLGMGVRGVFAMPVILSGANVGALVLYRRTPGTLTEAQARGSLLAADLAGGPIRSLLRRSAFWQADCDEAAPDELILLGRVEVAQATGMIMGQLDVGRSEALARLRGYAFAHDMTASDVAWNIVERRLRLDDDRPNDDANYNA